MAEKDYTYYDFTVSLCSICLKRIDAKVVFQNSAVYLLKNCPEHGKQKVLIASDIPYYKKCRDFMKPSEMPLKYNTETHFGCPYDCGLCPDHEQHSCLTLIEITDRCNLKCPTCYADSSPNKGRNRTIEEVEKMLDVIVANEGEPDVVQISGGEPTIHPDFFKILELAKQKPIKHLMVNTNGIKIANDESFVKKLAEFMPNFEIYLQFDSFEAENLIHLRGKDLRDIREKAIENLNKYNISTTLVVTIQKGLNDHELGKIIEYGLKQKCARGVTFQPTQIAGRVENFNPETDRYTLTECRTGILEQYKGFKPEDLIPVPCNPDAIVMGYALKIDGEVIPLTRMIDPGELLDNSKNTIGYEQDEKLKAHLIKLFSTGNSNEKMTEHMQTLLCCLPKINAPELSYENIFRVIIMSFMDAYNFDVRAIKKSCVHIVNKNNKIIPFETMNLFYRDEKNELLTELRKQ